jgi:arylsulfatase A-like enzyme
VERDRKDDTVMKRILIALALAVATAHPVHAGRSAPSRPPNIVLILADDLGWGDVGFNGRTEWKTPRLDRLAAEGTVFRRWYTAAVVCAPSRAALMTGKYTIHDGVSRNNDDLPRSEVTIAEALKRKGYATGLFGKWHHGKPRPDEKTYVHPMDQGFEEFYGFTDATHAWEKFPSKLWHGRELKPVSGYADDLFTDHAIDFLTRHRGEPFFLYLPLTNSHFHIEAPDDEVAAHRGKFPEKDPAAPLNATYAAMVTRLDRNVGRLADALDGLKLADDTLVVFTSDHGATFEQGNQGTSSALDSNRPFRGQKRTLWEGGIRVPALVRWPGHVPAGRTSTLLMHMTDLLPTFLAAAEPNGRPADPVDGLDMLTYWTTRDDLPCAPAAPAERVLFWEWRSEGADQLAAMQRRFKLVITRGGRPELFDVENDPAERRNIVAEHPERAQQLETALRAWLATERKD